jgi:hypothetical protein
MNTRDMWEYQVEILTKQTRLLAEKLDQMNDRMNYFENLTLTLIVALKKGGIIVDTTDDDTDSYEC